MEGTVAQANQFLAPTRVFRAGTYTTIEFRYTAGPKGLPVGARIKLALPNNAWGEPLPPYPRQWPESYRGEKRVISGWHRRNTVWRVEG